MNSRDFFNIILVTVKERISKLEGRSKETTSMKDKLTKRWNIRKSTDIDNAIKRTNIRVCSTRIQRQNGEEDIFEQIIAKRFTD